MASVGRTICRNNVNLQSLHAIVAVPPVTMWRGSPAVPALMPNYCMLDFIAFCRNHFFVNSAWLFPALLLALNVGAALMSFTGGNWRQGAYWLASAVCVAMVASK